MSWWGPRVFGPLIFVAVGGGVGYLIGQSSEWVSWWVVLGLLVGFGFTVVWDTWRGQRVLRWLRDRPNEPAPLAAGLWGEAAARIQKALRARERVATDENAKLVQFMSAIDASPNGVSLIDSHDGIVWCNATASSHFAIDLKRDEYQRITNLVRAPAFFEALSRGETDEPAVFDDARSNRRLSVLVKRYAQGMRLVLSQDVTQSEQADAMRRNFVANVSHEIRTPLTVLAGSLESLSNLPLSQDERDRMLGLMQQQTIRMQRLVEDLLMLAKLEGSPAPLASQWLATQPLWESIKADANALSAGKHHIRWDVDASLQVAADAGEFTSLVTNLVANAVRYTPEGGRIEVQWQSGRDASAELVVTDTGIGMAAEHLPRVTERFYRIDSSRSRQTGGTGLGLSIVKHIVQRHGAELLIDSEVGRGSTFRVRFAAQRVRRVAVVADLRRARA
jgi:two-component system, OmpR family, phosphate regulon sensor histidine kinase PhoR